MTADAPEIPNGPINEAPRGFQLTDDQAALLRDTLTGAGVKLGAYDERILAWLALWDWSTVAVITSWIKRAAKTSRPGPGDCTTCAHYLPAMPAEEQCNPDGCGCTGYPEACDVNAAPAGATFPISNCPRWEARA